MVTFLKDCNDSMGQGCLIIFGVSQKKPPSKKACSEKAYSEKAFSEKAYLKMSSLIKSPPMKKLLLKMDKSGVFSAECHYYSF